MVLRGPATVFKILHLLPNCSASSAPTPSTVLLPSGTHDDPVKNLSSSMPGAVYAPDTPLAARRVTPVTTVNPKPVTPEQIQRYLRRKPMYV